MNNFALLRTTTSGNRPSLLSARDKPIKHSSASNIDYVKASTPAHFTRLLGVGEEEYCRYAWSKKINKKKHSAWQAIGHRQSGKPVSSLLEFKMLAESYIPSRGSVTCSVDVFLSPNEFFDWRNTKQLAALHANWLEIDTAGHQILSEDQQKEVFNEVHQAIVNQGLPPPTGYVASGSGGIHLYWIYEKVPAYRWRVRVWREITLVLAKSLKQACKPNSLWHVDFSASRDPARVLRLPGTIHGGSGRVVIGYVGGPKYKFDSFAKSLVSSKQNIAALDAVQSGVLKDISRKPKINDSKSARKESKEIINSPQKNNPGKHRIGQWWFRIYSVICLNARNKGVKEGQRDLFAFILFVALSHIKPNKDEALKAIKALNEEFIGLTEEELLSYLKTAYTKHYKYKKDSIAIYLEDLGIDASFLYEKTKGPTLSPAEVKDRQQAAAQKTAITRRTVTLNEIRKAYEALLKTGLKVTQVSVASLSGRSIRTVRRYWSTIKEKMGSLGPVLYIPAPGVLAG